ncbi:MAG: alginate lyase family protein [Candidatus Latescibacteria bacterium]|nr:alginate lyase family protein [Candidatus Latescibacterota bacterium]
MTDWELFNALNLEFPDLQAVKAEVEAGDLKGAKRALGGHIRERKAPRWFFDWRGRPAPTRTPGDFPQAEACLRREFTFGFHGAPDYTARFGERIDWGANPTEGEYQTHLWNESLNRHFHFSHLADAYWETGDDRFVQGLVRDWMDWIEQNPRPDHSGNRVEWPYGCYAWQTLTTGIRLEDTWPNALYRCLGSPALTDEAIAAILGAVGDQARHLVQWPTGHNWLTEESMGLYTAGMLFPEVREAETWRRTAIERLYQQLTDEVYPDGAEYELAGGYGNWVVHNFVNLLARARLNGLDAELPNDLIPRMEKMFNYVLSVSMPDGRMPGLNDSGNQNIRELLETGHGLFPHRADFLFVASERATGRVPDWTSVGLPWSGHYVMRSGWDVDALFMLFDSGPYGSAHQHEDKLHFMLHAYGRLLALDPGSFSYDASRWRRYVLTTPGHNTVMVDGLGQHRRGKHATYFWPRPWEGNAPPQNDTLWVSRPGFDFVRGTYRDGYGKPKEGSSVGRRPEQDEYEEMAVVTHTRRVLFLQSEYWVIADTLVAGDDAEHTYESLFHLDAEEVRIDRETKIVATANTGAANLAIVPVADASLSVQVVKGQDDPVQGWANDPWRPVPTAVYTRRGRGTIWFAYVLYPTRAGQEVPVASVEPILAGEEVLGITVCFFDGRADCILFSHRPGHRATFGTFSTDAEVAVIRLWRDDAVDRAFLVRGSFIQRDSAPVPLLLSCT